MSWGQSQLRPLAPKGSPQWSSVVLPGRAQQILTAVRAQGQGATAIRPPTLPILEA